MREHDRTNYKEAVSVFSVFIRPDVLKKLREDYPVGCTVELVEMHDPYRNMPAGMRGVVQFVDDAGAVHIAWSNGSSLAALHGVDIIRRVD